MKDQTARQSDAPGFAELFTPKLVTVLREGYGLTQLRTDAVAGLTVAIGALPLSLAIAIASGASPAQGLYTAIVGGFLVSLLGGSRFQIGGPAGAFIVLVAATVAQHGIDGLIRRGGIDGAILEQDQPLGGARFLDGAARHADVVRVLALAHALHGTALNARPSNAIEYSNGMIFLSA